MKEPLVSKLTIPHASPLYHTGNNIHPSTNVGAILATIYYDTNLTKSPSQNSDPLDRFF
jgi:hypothetical protein